MTIKKAPILIGALVAASLFLAACGSDSSSTNAGGSTATTAAAASATTAAPMAGETCVQVASANPDFSTLVGAVKTAGLADTLSGTGPFTIFAPTNEAFAKLPAGTLESLTPEQLKGILTYHVVAGEVMAKDVKAGKVKTVNGEEITFVVNGSNVAITDAKGNTVNVVKTDIACSNGVIHVIDGVLLP